jgi:hypothetical protein
MNPSTRRRLGSANTRKAILNHFAHKFCNSRPKHYVYSIGLLLQAGATLTLRNSAAVHDFPGKFTFDYWRNGQMRIRVKYYLAVLAVLATIMPLWARVYKESLTIDTNKTIGSAQLKAGTYDLMADDAKKELNILQNGKAIATVQGQWVKLPQKAQYSTVVSDGDKITQVQFSGSDQAFQP